MCFVCRSGLTDLRLSGVEAEACKTFFCPNSAVSTSVGPKAIHGSIFQKLLTEHYLAQNCIGILDTAAVYWCSNWGCRDFTQSFIYCLRPGELTESEAVLAKLRVHAMLSRFPADTFLKTTWNVEMHQLQQRG